MTQVEFRRDTVPHQPLQLREIGKAACLARPDGLPVEPDLEYAASARHERHLSELELERGEQLLRRPPGAEKPAAPAENAGRR
jgi:hypothetical protein